MPHRLLDRYRIREPSMLHVLCNCDNQHVVQSKYITVLMSLLCIFQEAINGGKYSSFLRSLRLKSTNIRMLTESATIFRLSLFVNMTSEGSMPHQP